MSRLPDEGAQREFATRIVADGLKRDEAGNAVGKTARPKAAKAGGPKVVAAKPAVTKVFPVADAKLSRGRSAESDAA